MIAIPNIRKPQNCAECPISALSEFSGIVCKLNRNNDKSNCPLIDIVTCGECKWCDDKGKGRALICTNPYIDMDIHPLDFCSYGERRSDEHNT